MVLEIVKANNLFLFPHEKIFRKTQSKIDDRRIMKCNVK